LRARTAELLTDLIGRFRSFPDVLVGGPEIRVDVEAADLPATILARPVGVARRLFEPEYAFDYFPEADLLYFVEPGAAASCDPSDGSIRIAVDPADPRARFVASHLFFSILLLELLKRRGRFAVHAAAVGLDGRAALLAGPAGSGKSTLAFACARAGLAFLGDDVSLLKWSGDRLRVLAFPDAIELARDSTRFFPDLADLFRDRDIGASPKRPFHPLDRGPVELAWEAEPAVLLFPAIRAEDPVRLSELSADGALLRLVPNVVRTDQGASQAHLDALAALARTVPAYELEFSDPLAVPAAIHDLLVQLAGRR